MEQDNVPGILLQVNIFFSLLHIFTRKSYPQTAPALILNLTPHLSEAGSSFLIIPLHPTAKIKTNKHP